MGYKKVLADGSLVDTSSEPIRVTDYSETFTKPAFGVGAYGVPLEDEALTDNILASVVSTTHANKTAADSSSMALFVGNANTGDTANNKMQGILSSMALVGDVFDAYAIQGHVAVNDTLTSDSGSANIVGISAKATVATGKVATGSVSGILVTVDGAGSVTGQHSGIWIDNTTAAPDQAILISGNPVADISLSGSVKIFSGVAVTRAAVQALTGPDTAPIGSLFVGQDIVATTKPNLYIKVTATTWERVVTQASD
jgi:hypothetical protein